MKKVLFLDFDGPMIPRRAHFLPNQTLVVSKFDPIAVALLNSVLDKTGAKLVISSTWGKLGKDTVKPTLEENGISWDKVHEDWVTPRKFTSTREMEIKMWLDRHRDTTHWASLDDEKLELGGQNVKVSFDDGMQMYHYHKLLELLEVIPEISEEIPANNNAMTHINKIIECSDGEEK
jgi:hypothetical protein